MRSFALTAAATAALLGDLYPGCLLLRRHFLLQRPNLVVRMRELCAKDLVCGPTAGLICISHLIFLHVIFLQKFCKVSSFVIF
jgi:hypothetical protein